MCGSKFCIAAAGFGFSTRAYEAAVAGCIPLIMQDGIEQAYVIIPLSDYFASICSSSLTILDRLFPPQQEDLLPWSLFSHRLNNSLAHITNLSTILSRIPESSVERMRHYLYCVWPRFLWLRHDDAATTPLPDASRLLQFDAFESIFWTLRKRLHQDIGWPPDWQQACGEVGSHNL